MDARATTELPAGARGVIFQLCEGLGVLPRRPVEEQLAQLSEEDRKALARLGVRVGVFSLYFPSMLKPVPIRLRAGLWMIATEPRDDPDRCRPRAARRWTCRATPSAISTPPSATCRWATTPSAPTWSSAWPPWPAPAVRESREASRRSQQQEEKPARKPVAAATCRAAPAIPAAATSDEISEWAIVAAAFGEDEPAPAPEPEHAARGRKPPLPSLSPRPSQSSSPKPAAEPAAEAPAEQHPSPKRLVTEEAAAEAAGRRSRDGRGAGGRDGRADRSRGAAGRSQAGEEGTAAAAAGLVPRHAADDVAGRLLRARDGQCAARPRLSRASAVGRERAALRLLDQAALRARARGAARAPAPAAARTTGTARPAPPRPAGAAERAPVLRRYAPPAARQGRRSAQRWAAGDRARGQARGPMARAVSATDRGRTATRTGVRRRRTGDATTGAVRVRRGATAAVRPCASTPRRRRRAMRRPIRRSPSCSSSSSVERSSHP